VGCGLCLVYVSICVWTNAGPDGRLFRSLRWGRGFKKITVHSVIVGSGTSSVASHKYSK
jgi:hypothetical protein